MKIRKVSLHEGSGFQEKIQNPGAGGNIYLKKQIMSALFYVKNSLWRVDKK